MTDREALMRAVIANPLDDVPRLVMADWMDEHGEGELAEFIRVQIELSKGHPQGLKKPQPNLIGAATREFHKWGKRTAWGKRHKNLRERERELFACNQIGQFFPEEMNVHLTLTDLPVAGRPTAKLSRGFPSKVTLPDLAAWERWGAEIVRAAPVTEIVVSELEPYQEPGRHPRFFWQDAGGAVVWFNSRDSALVAAARAFADESRARAGLPPVWTREEVVR